MVSRIIRTMETESRMVSVRTGNKMEWRVVCRVSVFARLKVSRDLLHNNVNVVKTTELYNGRLLRG